MCASSFGHAADAVVVAPTPRLSGGVGASTTASARIAAVAVRRRLGGRILQGRRRLSIPPLCAAIKKASCQEAYTLATEAGYTYLDVRTVEEYAESHPEGAVNIPVMVKSPQGMSPNASFLSQVEAAFPDKDSKLCVGCLSGKRSDMATKLLVDEANYRNVVDVSGGFMEWQGAGLPCQQQ